MFIILKYCLHNIRSTKSTCSQSLTELEIPQTGTTILYTHVLHRGSHETKSFRWVSRVYHIIIFKENTLLGFIILII